MGQHLQMGVCYQVDINKQGLSDVMIEQVKHKLGIELDLSLYECGETEKYIHFKIKEFVVLEQLIGFLKHQLSMYQEADKADIDAALSAIADLKSLSGIIELAKEKQLRYFQDNSVYQYLETAPWKQLRVKVSLLVFFVEGKIIMESYDNILRYIECLVRSDSKWSIAGAFRAIID